MALRMNSNHILNRQQTLSFHQDVDGGGGATKSIRSVPNLEREHSQNGVHQIRARRVALLHCP